MIKIQKILLMLLAMLCCVSFLHAIPASAQAEGYLGRSMPQFSVTTTEGAEMTLDGILTEKDVVLVNFFATWCPPCKMEFPYLEEAYGKYKDRVEVVALSVEPTDTLDILKDYADELGLTFPMGRDTDNLGTLFQVVSIPTTVVVDRYGEIVLVEVGAQPSVDAFERIFDWFLAEDYTESAPLTAIPPRKYQGAWPTEDEYRAALLSDPNDPAVSSVTPSRDAVYPMIPSGTSLVTGNTGIDGIASGVTLGTRSDEAQYMNLEVLVSTEDVYDLFQVLVDDAAVRTLSGEQDWQTISLLLSPGEHEVTLRYAKDGENGVGEDRVSLRNLSFTDAPLETARIPVSDDFSLQMSDGVGREIVFPESMDLPLIYFASQRVYIAQDGYAELSVHLREDQDPGAAFIYSQPTGILGSVPTLVRDSDTEVLLTLEVPEVAANGYPFTAVYLYESTEANVPDGTCGVMLFANESQVDAFLQAISSQIQTTWSYLE
ncbi:MAG: redoxin domain-containing protein [Clostridia bacterium]|nr:redoxin domain-containing protein [Clostridia bacterium]